MENDAQPGLSIGIVYDQNLIGRTAMDLLTSRMMFRRYQKECNIVEERVRFIARLLDGEKMAGLCREFGISRKTGYKIFSRYKDCGIDGLTDRSRRPYRHANQLPMQIEKLIVKLKKEYPHWGASKIRERLRKRYPDLQCPAVSTVHAVLDRHGLVKRRKRRRYKAEGTALSHVTSPNEL